MLADQIATVIRTRLLDPVEILFGDAADLPDRVDALARRMAEIIEGDDHQAAVHAPARLVGALHPSDGPFDPPAEWWRTPLGRAVAKRIGHPAARRSPTPSRARCRASPSSASTTSSGAGS